MELELTLSVTSQLGPEGSWYPPREGAILGPGPRHGQRVTEPGTKSSHMQMTAVLADS